MLLVVLFHAKSSAGAEIGGTKQSLTQLSRKLPLNILNIPWKDKGKKHGIGDDPGNDSDPCMMVDNS